MAEVRAMARHRVKGGNARAEGNHFAILKLHEPVEGPCRHLELPGELRNRIYAFTLFNGTDTACPKFEADEQNQEEDRVYSTSFHGHRSKGEDSEYFALRDDDGEMRELCGPLALLSTNSQIQSEFNGTLEQYAPYHVSMDFSILANSDLKDVKLEMNQMDTLLPIEADEPCPVQAVALALELFCRVEAAQEPQLDYDSNEEEHDLQEPIPRPNEGALNYAIIASKEFADLGRRLRACNKTTDLVISWCMHPSDSAPEIDFQDIDSPHLIVESLAQLAETVPNLCRYSIRALSHGVYASRQKKESWESLNTVRFTHELMEYPEGEWGDLLDNFRISG